MISKNLEKDYKKSYSKEEIDQLVQKSAFMSHREIKDHLDSTITSAAQKDMQNMYFLKKLEHSKTIYVPCEKGTKGSIYLNKEQIPENTLRGGKIPVENFLRTFSARQILAPREANRKKIDFTKQWTRY